MKGKYCMVRTYSAGVFAGTVVSRKGKEVLLKNARRIWYWDGAASLSQLATTGTSKPQNCKFPVPVASVLLTEAVEIIPITPVAKKSIEAVPVWEVDYGYGYGDGSGDGDGDGSGYGSGYGDGDG